MAKSSFARQASRDAFPSQGGSTVRIMQQGALYGAQQSSLKTGWNGRPIKGGRKWEQLSTVKIKGWSVPSGKGMLKSESESYPKTSSQGAYTAPAKKHGKRCRSKLERELRLRDIRRKQTPAQRRAMRVVEA